MSTNKHKVAQDGQSDLHHLPIDPTTVGHPLFHDEERGFTAETVDEALSAIADGSLLAVRFRTVFSTEICEAAATKLKESPRKEHYPDAPDIGRIGKPLFDVQTYQDLEHYLKQAALSQNELDGIFGPLGCPVSRLKDLCDRASSFNGAGVLRVGGRPAFAGLCRYLLDGASIHPHQDHLDRDLADLVHSAYHVPALDKNIAFNVYVDTPPIGGELKVYDRHLGQFEYDRLRRPAPDSYAVLDECLPVDPVIIKPATGDVILFDASRLHAVGASRGGPRFSVSAFVGIGRDGRLHIYS